MKIDHNADTGGTSFHDHTVTATVAQLKKALGEPMGDNSGDDKVNMEWGAVTEDNEPFAIYDWKHYRPLKDTDRVQWHIGAKNKEISKKAQRELQQLLAAQ